MLISDWSSHVFRAIVPCVPRYGLAGFAPHLELERLGLPVPDLHSRPNQIFADRVALLWGEYVERGLLDRPEHAAGVHGFENLAHMDPCVLVHKSGRAERYPEA